MKLTRSLEDYIEAIFILSRKEGAAVSEISKKLKVKKPSAHAALKSLKNLNLINHEKYGKIHLTAKGKKLAERILASHNIITELLKDLIGIPPKKAAKQACIMEHALDKDSLKKITLFVKDFKKQGYKHGKRNHIA